MKKTVKEMVDWFLSNYKDPADGVPYNGREGGYQYFNGGPYDVEDELNDQFKDADYEAIEDAVNEVLEHGHLWVKNDEY